LDDLPPTALQMIQLLRTVIYDDSQVLQSRDVYVNASIHIFYIITNTIALVCFKSYGSCLDLYTQFHSAIDEILLFSLQIYLALLMLVLALLMLVLALLSHLPAQTIQLFRTGIYDVSQVLQSQILDGMAHVVILTFYRTTNTIFSKSDGRIIDLYTQYLTAIDEILLFSALQLYLALLIFAHNIQLFRTGIYHLLQALQIHILGRDAHVVILTFYRKNTIALVCFKSEGLDLYTQSHSAIDEF